MRKILNKFVIILILMVMALDVILPMNIYASEDEIPEGYDYGVWESETGWYIWSNVYTYPTTVVVNKDVSFYEQFYYEESGEKIIPTIDYGTEKKGVYLIKGTPYYIPKANVAETRYCTKYVGTIENQLKDAFKNLVAKFICSIANGLHYLVGRALGETVTIDDLVFNNYAETNISYFDSEEEVGDKASSLIYGTNGVGGLDSVINKWYAIFMKIALMGYMMILVYMGIRILLSATADQKASYKKFFMEWVIGITILFLFPYAMKYMIKINEAFVKTIEANKGYETKTSALANEKYNEKFTDIAIDDEIDWNSGNDYMSKIAYAAKTTAEPALAFVFLIMTWQLVTLIFHYYKRLFMIAFLIIIFPLVAFSYAVDKIADGKSQAFNTWAKELMLNIFVQTFHAIVYVFVCSTVYSAAGEVTGGIGYDIILIIVGVTFLFKGEEIIRQIFGQVSKAGTMRSLADSAAATFAKLTFAENAIKNTAAITVGKKSIPRKLARGANQIKATNARLRAFDKTATTAPEYNTGARLEHAPKPPPSNASDEAKSNYLTEIKYYNAAAVLNNPKTHSQAEKAEALNTLKDLAKNNSNHDVFKDSLMTVAQILALDALDYDMQNMISSGMSRLDIERHVTARMGVIFVSEDEKTIQDRTNTYFTSLYLNGSSNTVSKAKIRKEINEIIEESEDIRSSISFGTNRESFGEVEIDVASDAYEMYTEYGKTSLTAEEENILKGMAINIARLNQRSNGAYNEEKLLEIAGYVREHGQDNEISSQMVEQELGMDIDMFMHTLSKKIIEESSSEEAKRMAAEELENYETNARDGYFDDEISIHQVIKDMNNREEIDKIIEELYQNKKEAMKSATEEIAKEYLLDNEVDIMKNHYDTTLRTQDGYTEEELIAMKISAIGQTLKDLGAINKESASDESDSIIGWVTKKYLQNSEKERTGISGSIKEFRDVNDINVTAKDLVKKRRADREKIQNDHFKGDI